MHYDVLSLPSFWIIPEYLHFRQSVLARPTTCQMKSPSAHLLLQQGPVILTVLQVEKVVDKYFQSTNHNSGSCSQDFNHTRQWIANVSWVVKCLFYGYQHCSFTAAAFATACAVCREYDLGIIILSCVCQPVQVARIRRTLDSSVHFPYCPPISRFTGVAQKFWTQKMICLNLHC